MDRADIILSLLTVLPTLAEDYVRLGSILSTSATAINNANAEGGDGSIAPADWAALDAAVKGDLAALKAAGEAPDPV